MLQVHLRRGKELLCPMIAAPQDYASFYAAQKLEVLRRMREWAKQMIGEPLSVDDEKKFLID